jgi:3-oxoadipate enol-lactonase
VLRRPRDLIGSAARHVVRLPSVDAVPEGRLVELPGRGTTFVADVAGPPGAPTLLLLHSLACTAYLAWHGVVDELARHYRVVLFDQRWHGRGIRSPHFSLEDCADDDAAVLDALDVEQAVPIGYSLGGAVAQLVWHRHAGRLEGLVLCATARNFRGTRREKLFYPAVQTAMTPLSSYAAARVERLAAGLPSLPATVCSDPTWGRLEFRSTSAWSTPAVLAALGSFNSAPWIGGVDVPTSVVVTTRDHTIPARRQQRLAACIPDAAVFEVDGGHASIVLRADRFAPAVVAAVDSVVTRSRTGAVARGGLTARSASRSPRS